MAEPNNTPYPPSTPLAATPRSASPVHSSLPLRPASPDSFKRAWSRETDVANPSSGSGTSDAGSGIIYTPGRPKSRPIVLHIGDPVRYNPETYKIFSTAFDVVRPSAEERQRPAFVRALRERRWGDFDAIFRPFWSTGGEMGRWDAELIALLPPSMKVFASAGAGFDWADTQLLGQRGILYCNSGLAAAEAVADFAVVLIISTFRHIPWCMGAATLPYLADPTASDQIRGATFQTCHVRATAVSHNPRGHVLGLIGFGNIGQAIATKMRLAFGMRIAYYDIVRKPPATETAHEAMFCETLDDLVRRSDCVVLAAPASPSGTPLVGRAALTAMRPGTRFVNVARGSLVDEDALVDALERGIVGAAALDVHATEPLVNPRLLRFAGLEGEQPGRVLLTSHNAGGTVETHIGFEELSMRNILNVLQKGEAITPVNLEYLKLPKT